MAITFGAGTAKGTTAGFGVEGNSTFTVTLPTYSRGQVGIIVAYTDQGTLSIDQSWSTVSGAPWGSATPKLYVFYKVLSASETNPIITASGQSTTGTSCAGCATFNNVHPTTPIHVVGSATSGTGTPNTCAEITTTINNAWLLGVVGRGDNESFSTETVGGSATNVVEQLDCGSSNGDDGQICLYTKPIPTAGATGAGSAASAVTDPYVSVFISLTPGFNILVSYPTETETAQAVGKQKRISVSYPTQTQSALAITVRKVRSVAVGQASETDTVSSITRLLTTKNIAVAQITETDSAQSVSAQRRLAIVQVTETETAQAVSKQKRITVAQVTETDSSNAVGKKKSLAVLQVSKTNSSQAIGTSKRVTISQVVETEIAQAISKTKYKAVTLVTETDTVNSVASIKRKAVAYVSETDEAFAVTSELRIETAFETDIAQAITAQKVIAVIGATETDITFAINPTKLIAVAQTTETNTPFALSVQKRKSICPSSSYEIYCDAVPGAVKYHFFLEKKSGYPYHLIQGMDWLIGDAQNYKIGESASPTFSITLPDDGIEYTSGIVAESGVGVYSGMAVETFNTDSIPVIETDSAQAISIVKRKSITQITETDFADEIIPTAPGVIPVFRVNETDTAFTITALKLIYISAAEETEFAQGLAQILKQVNISSAEETDTALGISSTVTKYIDITQAVEIDKAFVIRTFNPADINDETLQVITENSLSVNMINDYIITTICSEFNITINF